MGHQGEDPEYRRRQEEQYGTSANLDARAALHARFSATRIHWHDWVFESLKLPPQSRILETGCGNGALWPRNLDRMPAGWIVTLTDLSPGMLATAKGRLGADARKFSFKVADVSALPFADGSFEACVANHMLYEPPDPGVALREIARVLSGGGRLYAATNGVGHMRELHELARLVAPDMPYAAGKAVERFSLDNGGALIAKHFAGVRLHMFEGDLMVTDAEAIIAYLMSVRDAASYFTPAKVDEIRRLVAGEIRRSGAYHVTRNTGMFEAVRDR